MEDEEFKKVMDVIMKIRAEIVALTGGKPTTGTVICPRCKKDLYFKIFKNGHIHGRCETLGCVRWME